MLSVQLQPSIPLAYCPPAAFVLNPDPLGAPGGDGTATIIEFKVGGIRFLALPPTDADADTRSAPAVRPDRYGICELRPKVACEPRGYLLLEEYHLLHGLQQRRDRLSNLTDVIDAARADASTPPLEGAMMALFLICCLFRTVLRCHTVASRDNAVRQ